MPRPKYYARSSWAAEIRPRGNRERITPTGRRDCRRALSGGNLVRPRSKRGKEPTSGEIKTISVHYLGPGSHKVHDELRLVIILRIDFGVSTKDGIRSKDEIYARRCP